MATKLKISYFFLNDWPFTFPPPSLNGPAINNFFCGFPYTLVKKMSYTVNSIKPYRSFKLRRF